MVFMNVTIGAIADKIWTLPGLSGSVRYSNGNIVTAKFTGSCPSCSHGISVLLTFTCQDFTDFLSYLLLCQTVSCCLLQSFSSDLICNPCLHRILPAAPLHWRLQITHHSCSPCPNRRAPHLPGCVRYREVTVGLADWIAYMEPYDPSM